MHFRKRADQVLLPAPPYSVSPSGTFDGDDGQWSTFSINVGDYDYKGHGQNFKVLISTSSGLTLVPGTADWCTGDCPNKRGVMVFNRGQPRGLNEDSPTTWESSGLYSIPLPDWWTSDLSANTTGVPRGDWGSAKLGLGESSLQSPILDDQWVVSYKFQDFFLGSLGLAVGDTGAPGATKPNFLSNLYGDAHYIPSQSYGYTAGAYYRNGGKGILGSLVLGGYDKSRMSTRGTSVTMPNVKNHTLIVGVPSIIYKPNEKVEPNEFSFTSDTGGFLATIDSTLPYLILPTKICDRFVERFQLGYDSRNKMYTVNATAHNWNLQQNATVKFKIVDGPGDNDVFTTIILPYAAFVQHADYPIYGNATQYFPIKKSTNNQYVLGRTFLQEAYIVVDYERSNFTVAPANAANSLPSQELVPIYNTSYTGIPRSGNSDSSLAPGAIAGIVVGIVLVFILAGVGAFIWWRKREKEKKRVLEQYEQPAMGIDTVAAGDQVKYRRVSELTGSETVYSTKSPATGYFGNDQKQIPPISEMSPDSTPAELYSEPPESASDRDSQDYFTPAGVRRRGATRSRASSALNTPGTPIAELPGDQGTHVATGQNEYLVNPLYSPMHSRGPSDTSLSTNIDEVLAGRQDTDLGPNALVSPSASGPSESTIPEGQAHVEAKPDTADSGEQHSALARRPSHGRGLSDSTIHSDSTAVSQPTPEELERWAQNPDAAPNRPLSQ